jgi:O-antigen ligase
MIASSRSNGLFFLLSGVFLLFLSAAIFTSYTWLAFVPFGILIFFFGWQQWPVIFLLLIFALPWSVEYQFTTTLGTDLPDEPLMLIVSAFFACLLFFNPSIVKEWKHPLIFLLLTGVCWTIITIFFSTDWLVSLKFVAAKTWYTAAFVLLPLVLFTNKKSIRMAGLVFLVSMLALTITALYRHYQTGLSFATINAAVQPFFRNHVNYSAMLVCLIPLLVAVFQLHKKSRPLILIAVIMVLTALFLSYARGAWLALLVGLVSYWLIKKRKLFVTYVVVMILSFAAVLWLKTNDRYLDYAHDFRTTIFHKNFEEHLVATYRLKDVSTAERFNRWIAGVRMIPDKWLTGYGPNTFYQNYKPYEIPAFKTWVSDNKDHSTVHDYFLLIFIEQGLPGLLFFLALIGAMLWYAEHLYSRTEDRFYKATTLASGVMLTMIITVNFLSDLIETDKIGSLFFLCLAVLVAVDRNTKRQVDAKTRLTA